MKKLLPFVFALLLLLSACGTSSTETITPTATAAPSNTPTPTPRPTPSPTPSPTPIVTPTPYDGPVNPLTGLPVSEDISSLRPLAIMLNNLKEALPQFGTASADIIYETLAEGGITRMLAVYQDVSGAGKIGSIRSARTYYLDLAQGHDAIFIHAGGSPQAYDELSRRGVCNLDGVRGNYEIFYRDPDRTQSGYHYEHTLFTTDELLNEYLPTYSIRREHEEDYSYTMHFSDDAAPASGMSAGEIKVHFSNYKTGVFQYDETSKLYMVSEYGEAYTDGNTGSQVAVKNVLVLYASVSQISNDTEGRLSIDLTGSGSGIFACEGLYIPIVWSKDDESSQFVYALEDGSELSFGRGTSYISIIPMSEGITIG